MSFTTLISLTTKTIPKRNERPCDVCEWVLEHSSNLQQASIHEDLQTSFTSFSGSFSQGTEVTEYMIIPTETLVFEETINRSEKKTEQRMSTSSIKIRGSTARIVAPSDSTKQRVIENVDDISVDDISVDDISIDNNSMDDISLYDLKIDKNIKLSEPLQIEKENSKKNACQEFNNSNEISDLYEPYDSEVYRPSEYRQDSENVLKKFVLSTKSITEVLEIFNIHDKLNNQRMFLKTSEPVKYIEIKDTNIAGNNAQLAKKYSLSAFNGDFIRLSNASETSLENDFEEFKQVGEGVLSPYRSLSNISVQNGIKALQPSQIGMEVKLKESQEKESTVLRIKSRADELRTRSKDSHIPEKYNDESSTGQIVNIEKSLHSLTKSFNRGLFKFEGHVDAIKGGIREQGQKKYTLLEPPTPVRLPNQLYCEKFGKNSDEINESLMEIMHATTILGDINVESDQEQHFKMDVTECKRFLSTAEDGKMLNVVQIDKFKDWFEERDKLNIVVEVENMILKAVNEAIGDDEGIPKPIDDHEIIKEVKGDHKSVKKSIEEHEVINYPETIMEVSNDYEPIKEEVHCRELIRKGIDEAIKAIGDHEPTNEVIDVHHVTKNSTDDIRDFSESSNELLVFNFQESSVSSSSSDDEHFSDEIYSRQLTIVKIIQDALMNLKKFFMKSWKSSSQLLEMEKRE